MLRDILDLKRDLWKEVLFLAQIGTFFASNWLIHAVAGWFGQEDLGLVGDGVANLVSVVVGAVLPSLVFAASTITVRWQVDGFDRSGVADVVLKGRDTRQFSFRARTYVHYESVVGYCVLKYLVRRKKVVQIDFEPEDSAAELKRQTPTGGARIAGKSIHLPINYAKQDAQQAMMLGSILPAHGGNDSDFATPATLADIGRFTRLFVTVTNEVTGIRIVE